MADAIMEKITKNKVKFACHMAKAIIGGMRKQKEQCFSKTAFVYEKKELSFERNGMKIFGELYLPKTTTEKVPTIIMCHGFGADAGTWEMSARTMAKSGYACYCFDFIGGNNLGRSGGTMMDMSVVTEQEDLCVVIEEMLKQPFVNKDHVYLMGESQGGYVAALTAPKYKDVFRKMVLYYPAFHIRDNAVESFPVRDEIPKEVTMLGTRLGSRYVTDVYDLDIWTEMAGYTKPVLIIHGTSDILVPYSYSEKALTIYKNARLIPLKGQDHGFSSAGREKAIKMVYDFFEEDEPFSGGNI